MQQLLEPNPAENLALSIVICICSCWTFPIIDKSEEDEENGRQEIALSAKIKKLFGGMFKSVPLEK